MEDHASTAVAITTIVSVTVFATKMLDLSAAWLKYKTQLMQTPTAAAATTTARSASSTRSVLRLLTGVWPEAICALAFIGILFWYAWWPRPVTTGAVVNITLATAGLFSVSVFIVFGTVVRLKIQARRGRDA